jgi:hypothetical protein
MKCKVGDLAVVINAEHRCNIGRIVHVVAPDDGNDFIVFRGQGQVWKVTCHQPMIWRDKSKRFERRAGPVPEKYLQPIRGLTPGQSHPTQEGVDALEPEFPVICEKKMPTHELEA